ncbi:MAG: Panacea domain-containing protein [Octadecabacter sp.]
MTYNPRKAAQTVAFFAIKTGEDAVNVLKAVKLVYLSDRENISRHGYPILDERRVSMKNGPVNSYTYNHIKGEVHPSFDGGWSEILADRANHDVGLKDPQLTTDALDELSEAEIATLDGVWDRFGHMDQWELEAFTHVSENVPEWEDPRLTGINSKTIPLEGIFDAIGIPSPVEHAAEIDSLQSSDRFLKGL